MPLRLTLICHAATPATRASAFPLDDPIEARAIAQAAALRPSLARADRVLTSPALRARQTAEALALDAAFDPALRDCDFGCWSGCTLAQLQREDPTGLAAWMADAEAAPHGGESLADLCRRVATWIDERTTEGGHTIAVTHAGVIRAAILHVLAAPLRSFWRIDIEPLGVVDLRSDGMRWALRQSSGVNRTAG
jgi:broad specificity phosphatase PhoE